MIQNLNTPEDFLRYAFGDWQINLPDTIYPTSEQRPKIYKAMHSYANHRAVISNNRKVRGYKRLLEIISKEVDIPKLLFDNPEMLLESIPSEDEITWARDVVRRYEEQNCK